MTESAARRLRRGSARELQRGGSAPGLSRQRCPSLRRASSRYPKSLLASPFGGSTPAGPGTRRCHRAPACPLNHLERARREHASSRMSLLEAMRAATTEGAERREQSSAQLQATNLRSTKRFGRCTDILCLGCNQHAKMAKESEIRIMADCARKRAEALGAHRAWHRRSSSCPTAKAS